MICAIEVSVFVVTEFMPCVKRCKHRIQGDACMFCLQLGAI